MMNIDELEREYAKRSDFLKYYGEWVSKQVVNELIKKFGSQERVDEYLQIPVKPRVKDTDSFIEKATVTKPTDTPFVSIHDQIGLRFVVLKLKDIKIICDIVEGITTWRCSKDRDFDEERQNKPDYFAYQSDHYVVWNKHRLDFDVGISVPQDTPCEIQIRTILQHAYAQMAHGYDYKPKIKLVEDDQRKVKRALAKGSALIETCDDVFCEIQERVDKFNSAFKQLYDKAVDLFNDLVNDKPILASKVSGEIMISYREDLRDLMVEDFGKWACRNKLKIGTLKEKQYELIIFRYPIVLLIMWLIDMNPVTMKEKWPYDITILEDIYVAFGKSTNLMQ